MGPGFGPDAVCDLTEGCITCGDVAVPLTVVESTDHDARCVDASGAEEWVATDLVGPVAPGDRLLVHAGVAIERIETGPAAGLPVEEAEPHAFR